MADADAGLAALPPRTIRYALGAYVSAYVVAIIASVIAYLATGNDLVVFVAADLGLSATVILACRRVSQRHGTGSFERDFGLTAVPIDIALGIAAFIGATIVAGLFILPFINDDEEVVSNTDTIVGVTKTNVGILLLLIATIMMAPLVEEVFFRGFVMRALMSKLNAPLANVIQAVVFGFVHVDPTGGYDNAPVVIRAFVLGLVFGALTQRTKRLGAGTIGHMVTNAAAMAITLTATT